MIRQLTFDAALVFAASGPSNITVHFTNVPGEPCALLVDGTLSRYIPTAKPIPIPGFTLDWTGQSSVRSLSYDQEGRPAVPGTVIVAKQAVVNGARLVASIHSNAIMLDDSPPSHAANVRSCISGARLDADGIAYQSNTSGLRLCWDADASFSDAERYPHTP